MSNETKPVGEQSIQEQYAEMGKLKAQSKKMSTKIKTHLKKHKEAYIVGGIGVTVGVGVGYYVRHRLNVDVDFPEDIMNVRNSTKMTNASLVSYKPNVTSTVNNVTNIFNKLGHPGNKIMCNETKELFDSQTQAVKNMGLNPSKLSNHLNGKKATVDGYTFTRMVPEESAS